VCVCVCVSEHRVSCCFTSFTLLGAPSRVKIVKQQELLVAPRRVAILPPFFHFSPLSLHSCVLRLTSNGTCVTFFLHEKNPQRRAIPRARLHMQALKLLTNNISRSLKLFLFGFLFWGGGRSRPPASEGVRTKIAIVGI
jgi:hypothetical protein